MLSSTTRKAAVAVGGLFGSFAVWKSVQSTSSLRSNETGNSSRQNCQQSTGSKEYLRKLIGKDKVVVFMKGKPNNPKCRYSKRLVHILKEYGVSDYAAYDILEDPDMRQGIKEYADWPTFPHVYFKGQFIGGIDIITGMHENGEFGKELRKIGIRSKLAEKQELQQLGLRTALMEKQKNYRNN